MVEINKAKLKVAQRELFTRMARGFITEYGESEVDTWYAAAKD